MRTTMTVSITPTEEELRTIEAFANFLDDLEVATEAYEHNADEAKVRYTLQELRQGLDDLEEVLYQLANDNNEGEVVEE